MPEMANEDGGAAVKCEAELDLSRVRAAAYRKVIEKYADAISAGETKTVPQLKELVLPNDESIQKTSEKLMKDIGRGTTEEGVVAFSYDADFTSYAKAALRFVQSLKRIHSEISIPFWMTPKDVLEIDAADPFDRALFYCSLLLAAGCHDARVRVVALDGGERHPIVVFPFAKEWFAADPCQDGGLMQSVDAGELLNSLEIDGKRVVKSVFEFNDKDYEEFD